jgi:hypothetical protein
MAKLKINFKKIDLTRVKQFLFNKGEKLALGIALGIGTLLVLNGLLSARSAGKTPDGSTTITLALVNGANTLKTAMDNAVDKGGDYDPKGIVVVWNEQISRFPYSPLMQTNEPSDFKRRNPNLLAVPDNKGGKTNIQMDFVQGGVLGYEINTDKQNATVIIPPGAAKNTVGTPAVTLLPQRMVVVQALFPMKEQLQEFAKELRMPLGELLRRKEDWPPRFKGLNITRIETDAKGQTTKTKLYWYDPKDDPRDQNKINVAPHLDNFFRSVLIDEESLKGFDNYRHHNLMTPLPKLANAAFPPVQLDGVKLPEMVAQDDGEGKKPDEPKTKKAFQFLGGKEDKGVAADQPPPKGEIRTVLWPKLPENLKLRFEGKFAAFDPLAGPIVDDKKGGIPMQVFQPGQPGVDVRPIDPQMAGKDPINDPNAWANLQIYDALIRFIDTDLEPGKKYKYEFQVRAWNPNFGKRQEVAFQALADVKELVSPWTTTPSVTVPQELFVYTVDQVEPDPKDPKKIVPRGPDFGKLEEGGVGRVPFQIHKWMGKAIDKESNEHLIADWVIAERLLVRRGDYIGRRDVVVQVPTWSKLRNNFEILNNVPPSKPGVFVKVKPASGISLDFSLGNPPPLLVDFEGGPKNLQGRITVKDESAMELLILNPDGKLEMRQALQDAEDPQRIERYETYRHRLNLYQGGGQAPGKGPAMPGVAPGAGNGGG